MSTYIDGFTIKLKDFCSVMTQTTEVRKLPDGTAEVSTIRSVPWKFCGNLRCSSQGTYEKRRNWKKYGKMGLLATNMKKHDEIF